MKPETIIIIRKLAREATIFALLGMVVSAIGIYVFVDKEDRADAKRQAAITVHAVEGMYVVIDGKFVKTLQVPLTNGTVLQVRRCEPEGPWTKYETSKPDCWKFTTDPIAIRDSVPLGNADQVAIEKDYWSAYMAVRHPALGGQLLWSLYVGLLGFLSGLVLWIFYRLVRFAVKG